MSEGKSGKFRPKILAFVCNWCAYGSTESSAVTGFRYPADIRIVPVLCSSRVDRRMMLAAFDEGADGVIVLGCNIGNCHYMDGNRFTKPRVEKTAALLGNMGIEPERLVFREIRASEGDKLADILDGFAEKITELGPVVRK